MPNFDLWSQENLAKFAKEAYTKMQEQQERIEQLQNELKDAIKAYRELNSLDQIALQSYLLLPFQLI